MRKGRVKLSALGAVCLVALLTTACTASSPYSYADVSPTAGCDVLLGSVIDRVTAGDTSGSFDSQVGELEQNCPTAFGIATDFFGASASAGISGVESCGVWEERGLSPEAIALLGERALCTTMPAPAPAPVERAWPEGGIGWDAAHDYIGTTQRVCGPLASVRGTYDGVFINIGEDYPSSARFTFVLWGDWWLDPIPGAATVCSVGYIYSYDGVTQMEIGAPQDLQIWS